MSSAACLKLLVRRFSLSRFHNVSPAGPKKTRRILLSMPVTSWPCRSKCSTASEPIKPLLPVTSTFTLRGSFPGPAANEDLSLRPSEDASVRLDLAVCEKTAFSRKEDSSTPGIYLIAGGALAARPKWILLSDSHSKRKRIIHCIGGHANEFFFQCLNIFFVG